MAASFRPHVALLAGGLAVAMQCAAEAAEGIVIFNRSGCGDRYVVETPLGYAILEWYGGNDPSEGDRIVGDFEAYGFKSIYNVSRNSEGRVWVENYMLSRSRVTDEMTKFCR